MIYIFGAAFRNVWWNRDISDSASKIDCEVDEDEHLLEDDR